MLASVLSITHVQTHLDDRSYSSHVVPWEDDLVRGNSDLHAALEQGGLEH